MFKIYEMNRDRQIRGRVFQIYDDPESLYERACLGYVMSRNRQMRDAVYDIRIYIHMMMK